MEKIRINKEDVLGTYDQMTFLSPISYSVVFEIAKELAARCVVLDKSGAVYEDYRLPIVLNYLCLKHASNLDVEEYENEDGMIYLYDKFHGKIPELLDHPVMTSYLRLRDAMTELHKRQNSFDYIAGTLLREFRESSNAKAVELSEKLIGLTEKVDNMKAVDFSMFAKK